MDCHSDTFQSTSGLQKAVPLTKAEYMGSHCGEPGELNWKCSLESDLQELLDG